MGLHATGLVTGTHLPWSIYKRVHLDVFFPGFGDVGLGGPSARGLGPLHDVRRFWRFEQDGVVQEGESKCIVNVQPERTCRKERQTICQKRSSIHILSLEKNIYNDALVDGTPLGISD